MKVLQVLTNAVVPGCGIIEVVKNIDSILEKNGVEVHHIGFDALGLKNEVVITEKERLVNIQLMNKVQELHDRNHYDVIHIHGGFHHSKVTNLFKLNNKSTKVILSLHTYSDIGRSIFQSRNSLVEALENGVIVDFINPSSIKHFNNRVIAKEEDLKKRFEKCLADGNVIATLNASEIGEIDYTEKKSDRIAYFGRITKEKKVDKIVEMCKISNIKIDFYGTIDPEYRVEFLEDTASSDGLIKYKGFLTSSKSISDAISGYSAVLLSTPSENTSMILIRSLMVGTPVIISPSCRGNAFYLKELGLEWLIPPKEKWSKKSLKTKSLEVRRLTDICSNLSSADREDISRRSQDYFSSNKYEDRIMSLY